MRFKKLPKHLNLDVFLLIRKDKKALQYDKHREYMGLTWSSIQGRYNFMSDLKFQREWG